MERVNHPIHFYDAANPENVPSGVCAAVYVNGYVWPENQVKRMGKVLHISVERSPEWAKYARIIDVERGAALPEDVRAFCAVQYELYRQAAVVYVNRSNWEAVKDAVSGMDIEIPRPFYWVATLDGTMRVADEWATQYQGGQVAGYDLSILHGPDLFHKT
jgi:hypothetical protein